MTAYHVPVMLEECIEALRIEPSGIFCDMTLGSGSHSRAILEKLSAEGHLYSFDQDGEAEQNIENYESFTFVKANFKYLWRFMRYYGVEQVDGILADLGVSSHQLDFPERGFSYRFDVELDMRMNEMSNFSAIDVLGAYSAEQLQGIFSRYGEVRNARTLAKNIVAARNVRKIVKTSDLNEILERSRMGNYHKYFAQVYQAIRMEVNNETGVLEEMLEAGLRVLKPGGRFVVMSYHSIEDRLVKNFFRAGNFEGKVEQDDYGHNKSPFKIINKKVITASEEELKINTRARSAKLRIAEKLV